MSRRRTHDLTRGEVKALSLIALGHESEAAAELMGISVWTFKDHSQAVCIKLAADNRAHAVQLGYALGWLRLAAAQPSPATPELPGQPRKVLVHAAQGLTNADIARKLWVSEYTVKTQIARAYKKLGAGNRAHAVHLGFTTGNLRLGPVPDRAGGLVPC